MFVGEYSQIKILCGKRQLPFTREISGSNVASLVSRINLNRRKLTLSWEHDTAGMESVAAFSSAMDIIAFKILTFVRVNVYMHLH